MMVPLLHHGSIIAGLPYTDADLLQTTSGGTPYGASHVAGANNDLPITETEQRLCHNLGIRYLSVFHDLIRDPDWLDEVAANDGSHPQSKGYRKLALLVKSWPEWQQFVGE